MAFIFNFTEENWHTPEGTNQSLLIIQDNQHNTVDPIIQVFKKHPDTSHELVFTTISVSETNDIIIVAGTTFDGKVVIK